jgi:hypothetical protein
MNRLTFLFFVLAIVAIGGGVTWYLVDSRNDAFGTQAEVATTTPEMHEGLAIYTNGPYGFSLFYPEMAAVGYGFNATYHLGSSWRANALPEGTGTPVVEIVPYAVTSEDSYPRYFNAMVRIGASADPKELARCEKVGTDEGETPLPDAMIGGRAWKAFSFQSAGMMQYASGVSYRILSEGKCIVMEKVRTGSSYKEDAPSDRDVPDATLEAEYAALSSIVESFTFAR